MTQLKTKLFVILMGSILATGLQGMAPQPQSWLEYLASFVCTDCVKKNASVQSEQKRKETEERLKQEKIAAYRQEAMGLRDAIFDKYKQGTLSSGVPLAKVDSISVEVLDPDMSEPEMPDISESDDAKWRFNYGKYWKDFGLWASARSLRDGVLGITRRGVISDDGDVVRSDEKPTIFLSMQNDEYVAQYRNRIMLHEMAHALDECLRRPEERQKNCYVWLRGDVAKYKENSEINLREWHADKQSAYWMKEYWPEEARILRQGYKEIYAEDGEKSDHKYAPYAKMIEWLSTYNPLRMKEIKKLGLLWNM